MAAPAEDEWPDEGAQPGGQCCNLAVEVAPRLALEPSGGDFADADVMVSIQVPDDATRCPFDVCCAVDVSGSMGNLATVESDGAAASDGLSVLDIVKHAIKTVMHMLKNDDRLALVSFNQSAMTVFALECMTETGRERGITALESLRPDGQTNIWAGLLAAMDALRSGSDTKGRQQVLLLLTDGQPNVVPPHGHLRELRNYKDSHPGFSFQLNTFGFGYDLDSELLLELASEGHGTYAFIPDAAIVGTTFVNSAANTLSTLTQNATLSLLPLGGAQFRGPVRGGDSTMEETWGHMVRLGPLQFGQSREVIVPMSVPSGTVPYIEAIVEFYDASGQKCRTSFQAANRLPSQNATATAWRTDVVRIGYQAIEDASNNRGKSAQQNMTELAANMQSVSDGGDARLAALLSDVAGRMSKALQGKDRFNRWGKHYLRAIVRAHQVQMCTNFMDPGLQLYGGSLFKQVREEGDNIFIRLPRPRPQADATLVPCDVCGCEIPFSTYGAHVEMCRNGGRRGAAPQPQVADPTSHLGARPRSPSPDMQQYYGGGGGG